MTGTLDPPVRRTPGNRRDAFLTLRLTPEALATIDRLATAEHRTRADTVRLLLQAGLRERK